MKFEVSNHDNIPTGRVILQKIDEIEALFKVMDGSRVHELRPVLDEFRAQINEKNKFIDQIDEPLMIRKIIELKRGDDNCETSGNSTSDPQQILLKSLSLA